MNSTALDWIETQRESMISRVTQWCEIGSGSRHLSGLSAMASALRVAFAPLGGEMTEHSVAPEQVIDPAGNVVSSELGRVISIRKRPDAPRRVLLVIHYDTVYGPEHGFTQVRRLNEHTLNGPGVADAKGGLCVMLTALQALEQSDGASNLGWEVLLNPDEELGSPGSMPLMTEAAKRNQVALVFEPALADGSMVGERKGSGNFVAIVRGRPAHAGRDYHLGRNAIHAAAELILVLEAINKIGPAGTSGVTVNVGKIDGGGPTNIVPDLAIVRFNIRVPAHLPVAKIEGELQRAVDQVRRRDGISVELVGGFTAPPRPMDVASTRLYQQMADCGKEVGLTLGWHASGGVSDANKLAAAGLPVIDTMGPCGGNLHNDQEFVLVDTLTQKAKLTALFMMKMAAGEIVIEG